MPYVCNPITGNWEDPELVELDRIRRLKERYEYGKTRAFRDLPVNQILSTNIKFSDFMFMTACDFDVRDWGKQFDHEKYNKIRDSVLEELDVKFEEQIEWFHHLLTRKIETK